MTLVGGRSGEREATRGQTGVDFLIGIGVFLLTVGFVVAFVPGMFAPFTEGQEEPMVADRAADTIVGDFTKGAVPSVLDVTCTLAFFDKDSTAACPFDPANTDSNTELADELGISASSSSRYTTQYHVNVTLEWNVTGDPEREVLCGSAASTPSVYACTTPTAPDRLAVGPAVPTDIESVVTASRVVTVDGQGAVLVVRVW